MVSPARELVPQLMDNELLSAQLEAVQLNGICTNSTLANITEIVFKLSEEVCHLYKDNDTLKMKNISMVAQPSLLSCVQELLHGGIQCNQWLSRTA
jgi:hypothetical protein